MRTTMTTMTNNDRARHITELASAFGVALVIDTANHMETSAAGIERHTKQRMVKIAPVADDCSYAVALHELGHCLHPLGMLHHEMSQSYQLTKRPATTRDVKLQLEAERAAWEWAHHYALEWTVGMDAVERFALGSYETHARRILGKDYR